jgi:hypothetical protein
LSELSARGFVESAVGADGEPDAGTVGVPLPGVELRRVEEDGSPITSYDGETARAVQVRAIAGTGVSTAAAVPTVSCGRSRAAGCHGRTRADG